MFIRVYVLDKYRPVCNTMICMKADR